MFGSATIPKSVYGTFSRSPNPLQSTEEQEISRLERMAMAALDTIGVGYTRYRKFDVVIDGEKAHYTPDFLLDMSKNRDGRPVLLEMHSPSLFNPENLRKYAAFADSDERGRYYVAMVTVIRPRRPNRAKIGMHSHGYSEKDIANQFGYLLDIREGDLPYQGVTEIVSMEEQLAGWLLELRDGSSQEDVVAGQRGPACMLLRIAAPQ